MSRGTLMSLITAVLVATVFLAVHMIFRSSDEIEPAPSSTPKHCEESEPLNDEPIPL